jgi:hypothetical protein
MLLAMVLMTVVAMIVMTIAAPFVVVFPVPRSLNPFTVVAMVPVMLLPAEAGRLRRPPTRDPNMPAAAPLPKPIDPNCPSERCCGAHFLRHGRWWRIH